MTPATLEAVPIVKKRQSETVFKDSRTGLWVMRFYDVNGRLRQLSCVKGTTKTQAENRLKEMQKLVEQAPRTGLKTVDEVLKPEAPAKPMTVKEAAEIYRKHQQVECEAETFRRYENILDKQIIPAFGHLPLRDVLSGHVRRLIDKRKLGGVKDTTVRQDIMVLSGIYSVMAEDIRDLFNPVSALRDKPTAAKTVKRYLRFEEEPRLLLALSEPMRSWAVLALDCGFRKGEIQHALWEDVRYDTNRITVRETKTGDDRSVPMTSRVREMMKRLPKYENCPYVFADPMTPDEPTAFPDERWRNVLKDVGIKGLCFRNLRTTFGTRLALAKQDPYDIKKLMGHKHLQTTELYIELAEKNPDDAIRAMESFSDTYLKQNGNGSMQRSMHTDSGATGVGGK